jgi:hypothetical protein
MLPILLSIGSGLAWFALTMCQLVMWGAGIGLGFWTIKKVTNIIDAKLAERDASRLIKANSALA